MCSIVMCTRVYFRTIYSEHYNFEYWCNRSKEEAGRRKKFRLKWREEFYSCVYPAGCDGQGGLYQWGSPVGMPRCEGRVLGAPWRRCPGDLAGSSVASLPWRPRGRKRRCSQTVSTLVGNNGDDVGDGATVRCRINFVSLFYQRSAWCDDELTLFPYLPGVQRDCRGWMGGAGGGARSVKGIS